MVKTKLVHEVRAPKNKKELENIVKAQRISEEVLRAVVARLHLGVTELEVVSWIKKEFIKRKAPILSFTPIVAFGKGSADIHHEPGKAKLKRGDTVMFDFGTTVEHYCSDMTRTYFFGEPSKKQKEIYNLVLKAMERALATLAKGEKRAGVVDKSARAFLDKKFPIKIPTGAKKGYQPDGFPHGLGHGVGTVIHEWPNFKPGSEDILPVGTVMTVEPGLYFKGFMGVRIEDMVLITKNGYKNLTNMPKKLEDVIIKI